MKGTVKPDSSSAEGKNGTASPAGEKPYPLLPVELCFGASWAEAGNVYHARFVALPHLGETICIPHREHGLYRVVDVRHQSATPTGDWACVRLLLVEHLNR